MRAILILDMSYTLKMFRERQLEQALESRKLGGYFDKVISVHPLAGLFESGDARFGEPVITQLDDNHVFVEGKIGVSRIWRILLPLNLLLAQIKLIKLLLMMAREAKVDVVRVGDPCYLGLMGWMISRLLRIPLVIRVCGNFDWHRKSTGKAVFPRLFKFIFIEKLIERFVFKRCAFAAAPNQNNLDYAIANGARPEKGIIFRYGNLIHPLHFMKPSMRTDGGKMLREIGVKGDFLVTVSRLEEIKRSDHNLLVLKRLRELGHNVQFVFIGDGSMRRRLEGMVKDWELSGHVFFAGNRSQEWIAAILPQARLVLSPHMGRALTEACLAEVPIVAYDFDWQGEIIRNGETGELVPAGDWEEMARRADHLLSNPEKAHRLGQSARQVAMKMMDPKALTDVEVSAYEALFKKLEHKKLKRDCLK